MPRVGRHETGHNDETTTVQNTPKVSKPRTVYTPEEKAARALERRLKAEEREGKKAEKQKKLEWEAKLPILNGKASLPNNIKVMFISDAKKQFALSDRELQALPIFQFKSPKKIIALSDLKQHATRRLQEIGVSCPALEMINEWAIPNVMTKTTNYMTGLVGRRETYRGYLHES